MAVKGYIAGMLTPPLIISQAFDLARVKKRN
jgi:hypothetical protein